MSGKRLVIGAAALGLLAAGYAIRALASGIPPANALTYAGVMETTAGPVNGSHAVQVSFYDAVSAGNLLCQSASSMINVVEGHFAVQLPDTCTAAVGANPNVWVDVTVDATDTGITKVGAVPYAVEANHAVNATSAANAAPDGGIAAAMASVPKVTAWASYSPTVTAAGTNVTSTWSTNASWRRVGDGIEVRIFSSGACTSGGVSWSLPNGDAIDSTKMPGTGSGNTTVVGSAEVYNAGTNAATTAIVEAIGGSSSVGIEYNGAPAGGASCAISSSSGTFWRLWFSVPVNGWTVTTP